LLRVRETVAAVVLSLAACGGNTIAPATGIAPPPEATARSEREAGTATAAASAVAATEGYGPIALIPLDGGDERLTPVVIQGVIRKSFDSFRLCYENGTKSNPNLQGRVQVRFIIDRSGATTKAENFGSDLPDPEVIACVVREYDKMSFPRPAQGLVTVVYPIVFSPGDEPDAGAKVGTK
jgi:hypothetical protein